MAENTGSKTTSQTAPANESAGNTIDADSYRQMVSILDQLRSHTHTFTDNYTTNCQCNCSRGSL